MEFIAIRENNNRRAYIESLKASGPQGQKLATLMTRQHPGQTGAKNMADFANFTRLQLFVLAQGAQDPPLLLGQAKVVDDRAKVAEQFFTGL